jgi:hypothetical protein
MHLKGSRHVLTWWPRSRYWKHLPEPNAWRWDYAWELLVEAIMMACGQGVTAPTHLHPVFLVSKCGSCSIEDVARFCWHLQNTTNSRIGLAGACYLKHGCRVKDNDMIKFTYDKMQASPCVGWGRMCMVGWCLCVWFEVRPVLVVSLHKCSLIPSSLQTDYVLVSQWTCDFVRELIASLPMWWQYKFGKCLKINSEITHAWWYNSVSR